MHRGGPWETAEPRVLASLVPVARATAPVPFHRLDPYLFHRLPIPRHASLAFFSSDPRSSSASPRLLPRRRVDAQVEIERTWSNPHGVEREDPEGT